MKIIAFINQKGGVGKSTITMNMASYLTAKGKSVLTIDLDPQGNTSQAYGIDTNGKATLTEVLLGQVPINEATYQTQYGYMILAGQMFWQSPGRWLSFWQKLFGRQNCHIQLRQIRIRIGLAVQ